MWYAHCRIMKNSMIITKNNTQGAIFAPSFLINNQKFSKNTLRHTGGFFYERR